jgi:hypothetical protein
MFLTRYPLLTERLASPTSTAQSGRLREVGARGRSLGFRTSDLPDQECSWWQEASYSFCDDILRLGRPLGSLFSQAPEHVEGKE